MHILIADRVGAQSIWSLMNPIADAVLKAGGRVTFVRMDSDRLDPMSSIPNGVDLVDIAVGRKRHAFDSLRQQAAFFKKFSTLIETARPDIVHTNFAVPGIAAKVASWRKHIPAIVSTQHEIFESMAPYLRLGTRLSERMVDTIVYISNVVAKSFGRDAVTYFQGDVYRPSSGPAHIVIPNGIDIGKIDQCVPDGNMDRWNEIVCVGRFMPEKGQRTAVASMPHVLSALPSARLKLIGAGPDEGMLRNLARELCVEHVVDFEGWKTHEEALSAMASAGIVLVPSTQEGFCLALAEAACLGKPIVASRIPVFEEVLADASDCAEFFEPDDVHSLAERIKTISNRKALATLPLAAIKQRFDDRHMAARYLNLYSALLLRPLATNLPTSAQESIGSVR